jgi:hypothetical protein
MSNASVAEEASAACESTYSAFDLDSDIYDLKRMLHAAEVLQIEGDGDEDSASSARLLVEKATKMAYDLHEKFGSSMLLAELGSGVDIVNAGRHRGCNRRVVCRRTTDTWALGSASTAYSTYESPPLSPSGVRPVLVGLGRVVGGSRAALFCCWANGRLHFEGARKS